MIAPSWRFGATFPIGVLTRKPGLALESCPMAGLPLELDLMEDR